MDGCSWLLCSWITSRKVLLASKPSTDPRCSGVRTEPHRVRHTTLFFTHFIQIEWVPKPAQDSGRDNPHYESLLVVEVPETSEKSLIHNIIQRRTQPLAVILNMILYRYLYIIYSYFILFTFRALGVHKKQQSLSPPAAFTLDFREWKLIGIVGVVVFNTQAPKSHCLFSVKKAPN